MPNKTSSPRLLYQSEKFKIFQETVVNLDGRVDEFEYVWRVDGTRTLAVNEDGMILLTREYRYELSGFDWRLPGGKLDSIDEPIEAAAARELSEETGVRAKQWRKLWTTSPDANLRFRRHFLLATSLTIESQNLDHGELIEVHWFRLSDATALALDGSMREEISALAVLRLESEVVRGHLKI